MLGDWNQFLYGFIQHQKEKRVFSKRFYLPRAGMKIFLEGIE